MQLKLVRHVTAQEPGQIERFRIEAVVHRSPVASELDREVHVAFHQPVLSLEPVELEAVEEGQLTLDVESCP